MKEKIKKYIKEIIIFIFVLTIGANALSYYQGLDLNKEKLDITSFKLLDGSTYSIVENKPILIYFWATWCPICKFESPNIQKVSKDYEVITIAVQSGSNEDIKKYLKENNLSFRVVNDENTEYSKKFNIKAFPTTFIYDKEKNLTFTDVGYNTLVGLYSRLFISEQK